MAPALPRFFAEYQAGIDQALRSLVADDGTVVTKAMTYTLEAPSKRVRPVLTLLAAELCGGSAARAMTAAAAMELVHTSSLILDDLPSMDDAALRRGRPANHVAFGAAVAILAAFGLLNHAYGALARGYEPPLAAKLAALIADAIGSRGLIGGQALDLLATETDIDFDLLERIHREKTGALFNASAVAGALTAGGDASAMAALSAFAKNLGLVSCNVQTTYTGSAEIGPMGGVLRVGPHRLTVPPYALSENVRITAVAPKGQYVQIQFQPEGLQFRRSTLLTMSYSECSLLSPLSLRIVYVNDRLEILEVLPTMTSVLTRTANAPVDHFSRYMLAD